MPFYVIDTHLPRSWAPSNMDMGGVSAFVHEAQHTRESAEAELRRLLGLDAEHARRAPGFPPSTMARTLVEAADRGEAMQLAEAEAYRRLGRAVPPRCQYFAVVIRSVEWHNEVLEKHVELVAGPSTSHSGVAAALEALSADGALTAERQSRWMNEATERWGGWPHVTSSGIRPLYVKAQDEEEALSGAGVLV